MTLKSHYWEWEYPISEAISAILRYKNKNGVKYRRLDLAELKELEKEFTRFLASQSIPAEDWEKMKQQQPERAEGLIGVFSDIVFDKVLAKVEYLEDRQPHTLRVYKLMDDHISMMGMMVEGAPAFDFTQDYPPQEMLARLNAAGGQARLFTGTKKFQFTKEKEAFLLMEGGALISKKPDLYDTLAGLAKGR